MENVKDLNKIEIGKGKALLKVVEKKSKIITSLDNNKGDNPLFSHYEVVKVNHIDNINVKVGDIVVAASGIGSNGGFIHKGDLYLIVNGFNLDAVTDPENFNLN